MTNFAIANEICNGCCLSMTCRWQHFYYWGI